MGVCLDLDRVVHQRALRPLLRAPCDPGHRLRVRGSGRRFEDAFDLASILCFLKPNNEKKRLILLSKEGCGVLCDLVRLQVPEASGFLRLGHGLRNCSFW